MSVGKDAPAAQRRSGGGLPVDEATSDEDDDEDDILDWQQCDLLCACLGKYHCRGPGHANVSTLEVRMIRLQRTLKLRVKLGVLLLQIPSQGPNRLGGLIPKEEWGCKRPDADLCAQMALQQ